MHRSELTVDLGAVRRNARTLLRVLEGAQLWAVVKANAYGHGAVDVAGVVLDEGAGALCVATVPEALELRVEFALASWGDEIPEGVRVHLKLDTGMGRWGLSELPKPPAEVVGLMSHLASADCDPEFTELQIERFRAATAQHSHLTLHLANSA